MKAFPLLLLQFFCMTMALDAMSFPFYIKGFVESSPNSDSGNTVRIRSAEQDLYPLDTLIESDSSGHFDFRDELPQGVVRIHLILSVEGCSAADTKRIPVSAQNDTRSVKLRGCPNNSISCKAGIDVRKLDSGYLLEAKSRGTAPFTYLWSTGDTTVQIRVDSLGAQCVTIEDANGCIAEACLRQHEPSQECKTAIQVKRQQSNAVGLQYILNARTNGTAPFEYLWSTGDTTVSIQVVDTGTYCVLVTDANGCQSRDCAVIYPNTCQVGVRVQQQGINGIWTLHAFPQGTPPFRLWWSTGDTTRQIKVREEGRYCVIIQDALGCRDTTCVEVQGRDSCDTRIVWGRATDSNASPVTPMLTARAKGRAPFLYKWSTGDTTVSIVVSSPEVYCVTVTDATGCTSSDCIDLTTLGDKCEVYIRRNGDGNLVAWMYPFPAISYRWSTGDTTQRIKIDTAGTYCIKATNIWGCEAEACLDVQTGKDPCRLKIHQKPVDGGWLLQARYRGSESFSLLWSTGDTTSAIRVDSAGVYCLEATSTNCTTSFCATIRDRNQLSFQIPGEGRLQPEVQKARAWPNPFQSTFRLELPDNKDPWHLTLYRMDGSPVWERTAVSPDDNTIELNSDGLPAGLYYLRYQGNDTAGTLRMIKSE